VLIRWSRVLTAALVVVLTAGPAAAGPPAPPVVDDPTGTVTTIIRAPGAPGRAPAPPAPKQVSANPCSYRYDPRGTVAENFEFARNAPTREQIDSGTLRWYSVTCPGQEPYSIFIVPGQAEPGPPPPTPGALAADARAVMQLPFPAVRHNPSEAGLVNLDTWLWLDGAGWQEQRSTLTLRGTTVIVVAKPTRVDWVTGDGTRISCAGQGRAYDPRVPADRQSTYCSHTYRRSSAGQPDRAYRGSATSSWQIRWVGTAPGGAVEQGELPPLELTTPFSLRVREVQDLVTRAG
jgi:hypothetical protein